MIKASILLAIIGLIFFTSLLTSMREAPNPAYTSAILLLSSVWLMAYNRIRNIPDTQNARAGMVMVFSALVLVLITA